MDLRCAPEGAPDRAVACSLKGGTAPRLLCRLLAKIACGPAGRGGASVMRPDPAVRHSWWGPQGAKREALDRAGSELAAARLISEEVGYKATTGLQSHDRVAKPRTDTHTRGSCRTRPGRGHVAHCPLPPAAAQR
jgi:hypothetical protein